MVNPNPDVQGYSFERMAVGAEDVIILRSAKPISMAECEALKEQLRQQFPKWKGCVIAVGIDQSVEMMPGPVARQFYDELKKMFEPEESSDDDQATRN
jgi:hypothetical protein